jgi:hypothetical protein
MTIKLIRVQDSSLAGSMHATGKRAFASDGLQKAMFPQRLFDPADPSEQHRFRLESLKKRLATPTAWSIAAVDDDVKDEDGSLKVLGYAAWYEPESLVVGNKQSQQEDQGWVEDGEGGQRGDGVKHPKCMDFKVHQQVVKLLEESKRTVLGEPVRPAWCMFITPLHLYRRHKCIG